MFSDCEEATSNICDQVEPIASTFLPLLTPPPLDPRPARLVGDLSQSSPDQILDNWPVVNAQRKPCHEQVKQWTRTAWNEVRAAVLHLVDVLYSGRFGLERGSDHRSASQKQKRATPSSAPGPMPSSHLCCGDVLQQCPHLRDNSFSHLLMLPAPSPSNPSTRGTEREPVLTQPLYTSTQWRNCHTHPRYSSTLHITTRG